jgi:hypothetical protein
MKKTLICSFVFLILAMSVISAYTTSVHIKTLPNHEVQIAFIKDSDTYSFLENQHYFSDSKGFVDFVRQGTESSFRVIVIVKKDGGYAFPPAKFSDSFKAGRDVYLVVNTQEETVHDGPFEELVVAKEEPKEEVSNVTSEVLTNTTEETNVSASSIFTGFTVSEAVKYVNNGYFYGGAGIIIFSVLGFLFVKHRVKNKKRIFPSFSFGRESNSLEDAERKLREAQSELIKLKKQDRISQLKKEIIEKETEIMRLRKS